MVLAVEPHVVGREDLGEMQVNGSDELLTSAKSRLPCVPQRSID
jgi:hypothetical protein